MENNTNSRPYQLDAIPVADGSDPLNSLVQQQMITEEESKGTSEM